MNRHLGYSAASKRKLKDGKAFNRFFVRTKPKSDPIINQAADTHDTVRHIKEIVLDTLPQTEKLANFLWQNSKGNIATFLKNVWQFQYDHIGYQLDDDKTEQLREPIRTWEDKLADCDCFSLFTSSILTNKGIDHYFRIVKMQNRSWYQHIYVIVPKSKSTFNPNNPSTYYTIDVVVDSFDYEPPGITFKNDIAMTIPVQRLNGIGNPTSQMQPCIHGAEFAGYGDISGLGLGSACSEQDKVSALQTDFLNRLKLFFINSQKAVRSNPNLLPGKADQYINDVNSLLSVWNDEFSRTKALDILSKSWENEADNLEAVRQIGRAMKLKEGRIKKVKGNQYLRHKRNFTVLPNGVVSSAVEGEMAMIPNPNSITIPGKDLGSIFVNSLSGTSNHFDVQFSGFTEDDNFVLQGLDDETEEHYVIEGLDGLGKKVKISIKPKNVFKSAKNAVKSVQKVAVRAQDKAKNSGVVKAASKLQNKAKVEVKQSAKKVAEVGKKVAKAVVKYSPVGVAARNGVLIWFKLNIGRNAERLIMAYGTKQQAAKAGLSEQDWLKAKKQLAAVEKLFVQRLKGDPNILRKNIFASRKAQAIKRAYGLSGLGEPVSASTLMTAAAPLIAAIASLLNGLRRPSLEDSPSDIEDPNALPPIDIEPEIPTQDSFLPPSSETQAPQAPTGHQNFVPYTPPAPVNPPQQERSAPSVVQQAEQYSDNQYQDNAQEQSTAQNETVTPNTNSSSEKSSNTGLIVGAIGGIGLLTALLMGGGKKKSLSGTDDLGCNSCSNPVGNTDTVNTDDVTDLSGVGKKAKKSISVTI